MTTPRAWIASISSSTSRARWRARACVRSRAFTSGFSGAVPIPTINASTSSRRNVASSSRLVARIRLTLDSRYGMRAVACSAVNSVISIRPQNSRPQRAAARPLQNRRLCAVTGSDREPEQLRLLEHFLDPDQELDGGVAVDPAVVEGASQDGHGPDHDLAIHHGGPRR